MERTKDHLVNTVEMLKLVQSAIHSKDQRKLEAADMDKQHSSPLPIGSVFDLTDNPERLAAKVADAKAYLRARNKYVLDETCDFVPTPYTTPVDILKKYSPFRGEKE